MRTKNKFTLLTSSEEKNTTDEVYAPLAVAVQKMSPRSSSNLFREAQRRGPRNRA